MAFQRQAVVSQLSVVMINVRDVLPYTMERGEGEIVTSSLAAHYPTPREPAWNTVIDGGRQGMDGQWFLIQDHWFNAASFCHVTIDFTCGVETFKVIVPTRLDSLFEETPI